MGFNKDREELIGQWIFLKSIMELMMTQMNIQMKIMTTILMILLMHLNIV